VALDPKARNALYVLLGFAVLAAIPIGLRWAEKRDDPVTRLAREKVAAKEAVTLAAKKDLACDTVELREPGGEFWAHGCGKRARYVPTLDGAFRLEGNVEPEEAESGCITAWTRAADAGTAREAAAKIHASGKPVRLRVPVAAFGVSGLGKLRYGEHVEVFVETDAGAIPDAVAVPCIDPAADGGVREGRCTKEWDAVEEVAECKQ
jgi:hypothetical protein